MGRDFRKSFISWVAGTAAFALTTTATLAEEKGDLSPLIIAELSGCWKIPALKDNGYEKVVVEIRLNRDGSLAGKPVVTNSSGNKNFEILAASAIRAVIECAPFKSVREFDDLYKNWRTILVNFDPTELTP